MTKIIIFELITDTGDKEYRYLDENLRLRTIGISSGTLLNCRQFAIDACKGAYIDGFIPELSGYAPSLTEKEKTARRERIEKCVFEILPDRGISNMEQLDD